MSDLNFQEVCALLRQSKNNHSFLLEHFEELSQFMEQVDSIGAEIFSKKDSEYILDMVTLLESMSATMMISRGEPIMDVLAISQSAEISRYVTFIIKLTVGLAVLEELR